MANQENIFRHIVMERQKFSSDSLTIMLLRGNKFVSTNNVADEVEKKRGNDVGSDRGSRLGEWCHVSISDPHSFAGSVTRCEIRTSPRQYQIQSWSIRVSRPFHD